MKEGWWWKFSPWQSLCVKKPSFVKTAVSSLKMSELEIFLRLTHAPNTSMQISRNKGATRKASRKMIHDSFFKYFGKNEIIYPKMGAPPKKIISHKSVHWYQCMCIWKMHGGEY